MGIQLKHDGDEGCRKAVTDREDGQRLNQNLATIRAGIGLGRGRVMARERVIMDIRENGDGFGSRSGEDRRLWRDFSGGLAWSFTLSRGEWARRGARG